MAQRISRAARVGRNRDQVLAAARRVFLARGYERATLDAIADEAGFTKGVMYSQFESKGDLFLALLEQRIAERAAQNEAIAKRYTGAEGVAAILRLHAKTVKTAAVGTCSCSSSGCTRRAIASSIAATPRCTGARSRAWLRLWNGSSPTRGWSSRHATSPRWCSPSSRVSCSSVPPIHGACPRRSPSGPSPG